MKKLLLLFLILGFTTKVNAQQLLVERDYPLNPKMMNTLVYHTPHHESPKLKFTFKSAINKSSIQKMEGDDGLQLSQVANYNMRLRWKFNNQNRVYIGMETMTIPSNIFYIGFRKQF